MKRNQSSLLSDSAFLLLFVICFISIVFTAGDPNRYIQNIVFLNAAFLIAIITYFTTLITGLVLNILFILDMVPLLCIRLSLWELLSKAILTFGLL